MSKSLPTSLPLRMDTYTSRFPPVRTDLQCFRRSRSSQVSEVAFGRFESSPGRRPTTPTTVIRGTENNYFRGGQLATKSEPVRGTDDPELFESARWGNFSYAIPVTPGKYELKLYFSALNRRNSTDATAVEQIFSVFCNGRSILDNFNLQERCGEQRCRNSPLLQPGSRCPRQTPLRIHSHQGLCHRYRHRSSSPVKRGKSFQ